MKRKWILCLGLALLLAACGRGQPEPETFDRQIWTNDRLAEVGGEKTPRENACLVVALQQDEGDRENIQRAGNSLMDLVDGLHRLEIAGEDAQQPYAGYRKVFTELEMEAFPFEMVDNPNQAAIKLEYELSYPSAGKFSVGGQMVEARGCKLRVKAVAAPDGRELAAVEVTNAPSSADELPEGAQGEVRMSSPDLSKGVYAEKMLKFFREIQGA